MSKLLLFFILFIISGCATARVAPAYQPYQKKGFEKVLYIVLENTNKAEAMKQPFLAEMIQRGALIQNMTAESHPSQGNYIAMIAGDTLGVVLDNDVNLHEDHFGDLLENHGRTWKVYAEDFPGNCFTGNHNTKFARKHVPFLSFLNVTTNPVRCANIVNAQDFTKDLSENKLPDFSMYIPNLENDGHNTNVTFASKYLSTKFGTILHDSKFLEKTLVIITFDESKTYFSNNIYTALLGGVIHPGSITNQQANHISLLRLIEEEWSLGSLNRQDRYSEVLDGIWN